jgi:hypothetical protein
MHNLESSVVMRFQNLSLRGVHRVWLLVGQLPLFTVKLPAVEK